MNTQPMKRYYILMLALVAATTALFFWVLVLSSSYKTDKKTNETASKIAEDLNDYIMKKSKIPDNLDDATDETVPASITYKKDKKTYTFCVTYKSASQGGIGTDPTTILFQTMYGGSSYDNYSSESSYKPSSLYISTYSWEKGEQCTTVEPYMSPYQSKYNSGFTDDSETDAEEIDSSEVDYSDPNFMCKESYEYYGLYKEYCVDGVYQSPQYN